jgi:hypothetical protein
MAELPTPSTPHRHRTRSTRARRRHGLVEAAGARRAARRRPVELGAGAGAAGRRPAGESAALTLDALDFALPAAIEIPRVPGWRDALDTIAADGAERVKFRTGGLTAAAHPTEAELAERIVASVRSGARFKLTAGLHHPLRRTDPETGFESAVSLNASRTALALDGGDVDGSRRCWRSARPPLLRSSPPPTRGRCAPFTRSAPAPSRFVTALRELGMLEDGESSCWVPEPTVGLRPGLPPASSAPPGVSPRRPHRRPRLSLAPARHGPPRRPRITQ